MTAGRPCRARRPRLSDRSTFVRGVVEAAVEAEAEALEVAEPEAAALAVAEPVAAAVAVVEVVLQVVVLEVAAPEARAPEARAQDRAVQVPVPVAARRAAVHQARRVRAPRAAQPVLAPEYPILGVPLVLASRRDQARPVLAQPTVTGLRERLPAAGTPEHIMEAERSRRGLAPTRCARSTSTAIAIGPRPIV